MDARALRHAHRIGAHRTTPQAVSRRVRSRVSRDYSPRHPGLEKADPGSRGRAQRARARAACGINVDGYTLNALLWLDDIYLVAPDIATAERMLNDIRIMACEFCGIGRPTRGSATTGSRSPSGPPVGQSGSCRGAPRERRETRERRERKRGGCMRVAGYAETNACVAYHSEPRRPAVRTGRAPPWPARGSHCTACKGAMRAEGGAERMRVG